MRKIYFYVCILCKTEGLKECKGHKTKMTGEGDTNVKKIIELAPTEE